MGPHMMPILNTGVIVFSQPICFVCVLLLYVFLIWGWVHHLVLLYLALLKWLFEITVIFYKTGPKLGVLLASRGLLRHIRQLTKLLFAVREPASLAHISTYYALRLTLPTYAATAPTMVPLHVGVIVILWVCRRLLFLLFVIGLLFFFLLFNLSEDSRLRIWFDTTIWIPRELGFLSQKAACTRWSNVSR